MTSLRTTAKPCNRWMRFAAAAVFFACTAGLAHTNSFDLGSLMQLLAAAPSGEVAYTEKKYSALLDQPILSSGTLAFRRPDTVEKITLSPRKEQFRIAGEELIVVRNGKERRIALSSQPLLEAFAASLRGVLSGNISLLRAHYRIVLAGDEKAWQLVLIPNDEEMARHVERILVAGHGGRIAQIEVRESSGDRSVLQVASSARP